MKSGIHPQYGAALVTCSCGHVRETRSTRAAMRVEVCSGCHPVFTGERRTLDTSGRIDRFHRRYGIAGSSRVRAS